jgi:leader peptidase (prepilin peptidase)/N-methyltransferase
MEINDLTWTVTAVALGPLIGSFVAVAADRMPAGRPMGLARSACDACGRTLDVRDLVPIVSYLALRGRCRSCGARIPLRLPLIEAGAAGLALWAGFALTGPAILIGAILGWQLLLLALLDAEHFWLPRVLTIPLIASGLAVALALGVAPLFHHALGAAIGFIALSLMGWGYRRLRGRVGLGGGDAWMAAGAGAWTGWVGLPSVLVIAALSGIAALLIARLKGRAVDRTTPAPFGVFLALGIWTTWLYGPLGLG